MASILSCDIANCHMAPSLLTTMPWCYSPSTCNHHCQTTRSLLCGTASIELVTLSLSGFCGIFISCLTALPLSNCTGPVFWHFSYVIAVFPVSWGYVYLMSLSLVLCQCPCLVSAALSRDPVLVLCHSPVFVESRKSLYPNVVSLPLSRGRAAVP
jgi:hypothetical protein